MIFQSSAEITAWPERIGLTLLFVGIVSLIYFAMYKNWKSKAMRDQELEQPLGIEGRTPLYVYEGKYIATTYADDWLKRVHINSLAFPSQATLQIFDDGVGIILKSEDLFISFDQMRSIESINALAGKVFEAEGLIGITWELGSTAVVTGFRTLNARDHISILELGVKRG
ncbi:MAG: hypothetical protein ACO3BI_02345 [Candidatus Nanopelagicales bacterium]